MMVFWQESIPRRPNNSRTRCLSRREEASTDVMGTSRQPLDVGSYVGKEKPAEAGLECQ